MTYNGRIHDTCVIISILLIVVVPSVFLFFADGGQLYGLNYDPETIPKQTGINGLSFTVLDDNIEPIYDGSEIIKVELWQLPLRDIFRCLITQPMAYVPPSFSKLLSLIYLTLSLTFFILYRQKSGKKVRSPDSRQEMIYQHILSNPGASQQQIVNATGFSRGSVRHHLSSLCRNHEITTADIEGHKHYLPNKQHTCIEEQMFLIAFEEEKTRSILRTLYENTNLSIFEISNRLGTKQNNIRWKIYKLEMNGLLTHKQNGNIRYYSLTKNTIKLFRQITDQNELVQFQSKQKICW